MLLVNSFDVEPWWACWPSRVDVADWENYPDRTSKVVYGHLDLCARHGVRTTYFVVGWYGRKHPEVLAEIVRQGHEIGCHSLHHEDVDQLDQATFEQTTREAKRILEDVGGAAVESYRAPSFSITPKNSSWFFDTLANLGFAADSSVTTAMRIYGGGFDATGFDEPKVVDTVSGKSLVEVPVPGVRMLGKSVQLYGGGYLRLFPQAVLRHYARREAYQSLYVHSLDFDPAHPDLPGMPLSMNFRRRARMGDSWKKLEWLYANADVRTVGDVVAQVRNRQLGVGA